MRIPPRKDIATAGIFLVITVALVLSSVWAWRQFITTAPYVDPQRYPIRGIDVSAHNGYIDFFKVTRAGIEFVFIKASEGAEFKDKNFRANYRKARHAEIKTGAYHFFRFDVDGVDQAVNFLEAVGERKLDLGLVIDVEQQGNPEGVDPALVVDRLTAMAEYLNLKGYRVMFYTNRSGYEKYLLKDFPGYPLWICSFSEHPFDADWTFWQYDHHGHVDGIRGDVDLDTYVGNRADWSNYN